jgi:hypothetical protein
MAIMRYFDLFVFSSHDYSTNITVCHRYAGNLSCGEQRWTSEFEFDIPGSGRVIFSLHTS